ncbi:MAG: OmpA family protein [Myxococcales bacterium]|nr:OmpA family protein [Myxococcales bacterium]
MRTYHSIAEAVGRAVRRARGMTAMTNINNRWFKLAVGTFAVALGLTTATPSQAADFDAQQFRFSPHALDLFQIESAKVSAKTTPNAFIGFNFAAGLLDIDGEQVVESLATLNVLTSLALGEHLSMGLDVPLHVMHGGVEHPFNKDGEAISGFSLGDVAIGFKGAIFRPVRTGVGLGASFTVTMPTGGGDLYTAEAGPTLTGKFLVDAYMTHFKIMLNAGFKARAVDTGFAGAALGNELVAGLGFGIPFLDDQLEIIQETTFGTQADKLFDEGTSRVELHGGIRYRHIDSGFAAAVGGGAGMLDGISNADFRVFATVGYQPAHYAVLDADGDGILDDVDACPNDPEDMDNFQDQDGCPDDDNDGDGVKDAQDKCPNDAEDKDAFQDEDGCPDLDNDNDGIADVTDKCPNDPEDMDGDMDDDGCPDIDTDGDGIADYRDQCPKDPEDKDGFQDEDGCPDPDNDGDGVLDTADKCPNQPEDKDNCQDDDGCPEEGRVCVEADRIAITEMVFFKTGKAIIDPISFPLLAEVAEVMKTTAGLRLIEIQGHTDDVGNDKSNLRLSQKRADAVRQHLIKNGVNRKILSSKGYGETVPLLPNDSDENRAKNRRVEFKILKRD